MGLLERRPNWLFSVSHSSSRDLLCTYYVLGTSLGAWNTSGNKRRKEGRSVPQYLHCS